MIIPYNAQLDLIGNNHKIDNIKCVVGDTNAYKLNINIVQGTVAADLTNHTAKITFLKPDNTTVFQDLTIDDAPTGKAYVTFDSQVIAVSGTVKAEINIYDTSTGRLTSGSFAFMVKTGLLNESTVESSNEFSALVTALSTVTDFVNTKTELQNARQGKASLLENLQDKDSQLADITLNLNSYWINGYTSWRPALTNALSALSALGGGTLLYPKNTNITIDAGSAIVVPDDITIRGNKGTLMQATGDITYPSDANNQGQIFHVTGKNVHIEYVFLDGQNHKAGLVCFSGASDCFAEYNSIVNATTAQAITLAKNGSNYADNIKVNKNYIYRCLHGIQFWLTKNCSATKNRVNVVSGGGIWSACSYDLIISGNNVSNCADVGIDLEGGKNCNVYGNDVTSCKNGELSIFQDAVSSDSTGCYNLVFDNNTINSGSTYTTLSGTTGTCINGALYVNSVNEGNANNIIFKNNTIKCNARKGIYTENLGTLPCGITWDNNTFYMETDTSLFTIQQAYYCFVINNKFKFKDVFSGNNIFKNCNGSNMEHNKFMCLGSTKTTDYMLYLYTDVNNPNSITIEGNEFIGCGEFACKVDAWNSNPSNFMLIDNIFSRSAVNNGGLLVTNNYGARFFKQTLRVLLPSIGTVDLSTLAVFKSLDQNTSCDFTGVLKLILDSVKRNLYEVVYFKRVLYSKNGSGNPSGILNDATYYVTISGSTITFPTYPAWTINQTELNIVCNSI